MTSKKNKRRKPSRRTSRRTSRRKRTVRRKSYKRRLAGLTGNIFGSPKKLKESLDKLSVKVNGSAKPKVESDIKTWKCILCNEIGHTWRECPKFADKKILTTVRGKDNATVKDKEGKKLQRSRYDDEFFNTNIKPHLPNNFIRPKKRTKKNKKKSAKAKSAPAAL